MPSPPLPGSSHNLLEPPQSNGETRHRVSKRQRLSPNNGLHHPPAFWDKLSEVWLTNQALRELDRRNRRNTNSISRSPRQPAERKRHRQTSQYSPRSLKAIKSFSRHGGPDLSDLRHCRIPAFASDHTMKPKKRRSKRHVLSFADSSSTDSSPPSKTKKTGVYDRNFEQMLVDHDIYPYGYMRPDGTVPSRPENHGEITQILTQRRPSLSSEKFTEKEFYQFVRADNNARKEKQVLELVLPLIEGNIGDDRCRSGGIPFNNLGALTDEDVALKPANPDIYYGARPEQLSRKVRNELSRHIIPSTQDSLPMAANFLLAAKGLRGSSDAALLQACYNGALGARAIHSLQSYRRDASIYTNNAYTLSMTYQSGILRVYCSHITPPRDAGGRPEYHLVQLRVIAMTDTPETCADGLRAYRNGRDWAEQQRNEAIGLAKERANLPESAALVENTRTDPAQVMNAASEIDTREDIEESDNSVYKLDQRVPAKRKAGI